MKLKALIACSLAGLSACASTQLNHNTLNLAASLDSLNSHQIYYNLEQTLADPYAVPAQVGIAAGTATTTNGVAPTFSLPFGTSSVITNAVANTGSNMVANAVGSTTSSSVANTLGSTTTTTATNAVTTAPSGATTSATNTLANAVANNTTSAVTNGTGGSTTNTATNGTTTSTTNTDAVTHPNKSLSLGFTDNWSQGWTLDPAADPDELRRLRALYRFVLGLTVNDIPDSPARYLSDTAFQQTAQQNFICEYPLQTATTSQDQVHMQQAADSSANVATAANAHREQLQAHLDALQDTLNETVRQLQFAPRALDGTKRTQQQQAQQLQAQVRSGQEELDAVDLDAKVKSQVAQNDARGVNQTRTTRTIPMKGCEGAQQDANGKPYQVTETVDVTFLRPPSCVICWQDTDATNGYAYINPKLRFGFIRGKSFTGSRRLHWSTSLHVCLTKDGGECLDGSGMKAFHEFVLFVYEAAGRTQSPNSTKNPRQYNLNSPGVVF